MQTRLMVTRPNPSSGVSLGEFGAVIEILKDLHADGRPEEDLPRRLPAWLLSAFALEMNLDEKAAWLSRWRGASAEEKAVLERDRGWELLQWLYWFVSDEVPWRLSGAELVGYRLMIYIDQDDDPVPMGALEWTVGVAGLTIDSVDRIY